MKLDIITILRQNAIGLIVSQYQKYLLIMNHKDIVKVALEIEKYMGLLYNKADYPDELPFTFNDLEYHAKEVLLDNQYKMFHIDEYLIPVIFLTYAIE